MFKRLIHLSLTRSFFLFGARSTGKSTLLRELLPETKALWIDLLDPDLERTLSQSPSKLSALLEFEKKHQNRTWVVIDEIQKVPELLSIVQQFLHQKQIRFAMTGSSARKLRRGASNLLAGRASWFELFPLTHLELDEQFELQSVLNWGSLPEIFELTQKDKIRFLKAYCNIYLKEEILAEQLIRKVQPFRNFIELVALQNGQIINYSKFATDCGVDLTTIQTYFEILQDTLIGFMLLPFHESIRKRQRKNPKFYLFDTGVTRALAGHLEGSLEPRTSAYGRYFEQWIINEIYRFAKCFEQEWRFSYLTTKEGAEIDLILEIHRAHLIAIEIKSYDRIDEKEVFAFERLASDLPHAKLLFISQDQKSQRYGNVDCLHWQKALVHLKSLMQ